MKLLGQINNRNADNSLNRDWDDNNPFSLIASRYVNAAYVGLKPKSATIIYSIFIPVTFNLYIILYFYEKLCFYSSIVYQLILDKIRRGFLHLPQFI